MCKRFENENRDQKQPKTAATTFAKIVWCVLWQCYRWNSFFRHQTITNNCPFVFSYRVYKNSRSAWPQWMTHKNFWCDDIGEIILRLCFCLIALLRSALVCFSSCFLSDKLKLSISFCVPRMCRSKYISNVSTFLTSSNLLNTHTHQQNDSNIFRIWILQPH